jgi:predicted kinase
MAGLGEDIAGFHDAADAAPADGTFGDPDRVHRVTLDNFAELRRLPEAAPWLDKLNALEARLTLLLERDRSLMIARREEAWVRECHGDLHCGNVVRWQGRLTPFDGIEFEPGLRYIDVVNDIAFLTMDLAERGHAELRWAVLQAWREALGDCEGLPLLPYYEAYRALVRAKVAALRALQEEPGSPDRAGTVATCERYFDWATDRVRERRPALLMTCGLSGSGKTWLARQLAPRLGALHLRSDVERKRLAGLAPHEDSRSPPDGGIYTREFNERTYVRLHECAAACLAAGEHVIVDAAFLRRDERRRLLTLASENDTPAAIVHCRAPDAVLRERVIARTAARTDASEAGPELLARQPGYWEPFDASEQPQVIEVDTSAPEAVAQALSRLESLADG